MTRILALLVALAAAAPATARDGVRVMSVNVRLPLASDGEDAWPNRRDRFMAMLRAADADVIGTQELFEAQGADIVRALPRYAWFGRDRRGGHGDEHMGIFYRTDRLTLVASGDFWLSDTPAVPGSITWGHPLPRMVNWGVFADRRGRRFALLDTHFPYRDEDEAARTKAAALIARRLPAIARDMPVVVTGDFNTTPDSAAYRLLVAPLRDARTAAKRVEGPAGTFHGFTGTPERRIDWILLRGFTVDRFRTIDRRDNGRYPSDHFPVVADLRWQR